MVTDSIDTVASARRWAVSWLPHPREKVSSATSSTRLWSRTRVTVAGSRTPPAAPPCCGWLAPAERPGPSQVPDRPRAPDCEEPAGTCRISSVDGIEVAPSMAPRTTGIRAGQVTSLGDVVGQVDGHHLPLVRLGHLGGQFGLELVAGRGISDLRQ